MENTLIYRLVLIITVVTAAATAAASNNDDDPELTIYTSEFISEEKEDAAIRDLNSIAERKVCKPTNLCTLAGGFCVKKKKDCEGTLDASGCKGKKCKCCIPDETTPPPPTCPVITCPAPTTLSDITCPACPTCPTTVPTTTSGLDWQTCGRDRFVRFGEKMIWNDARSLCKSHGLDMYHPIDLLKLAEYLEKNPTGSRSADNHWLGARGNGHNMVWLSGEVIPRNNPLWYSTAANNFQTYDCAFVLTHSKWYQYGTVLSAYRCHSRYAVLCG